MPLPRSVARFNKRYANRFVEPLVAKSSTFVIVEHAGRRSGATYRTPINLFDCDGGFVAALTYGPSADWVQNVLAGPARCERAGLSHTIDSAALVPRASVEHCLPRLVRMALRILRVDHFLLVSLSPIVTSQ